MQSKLRILSVSGSSFNPFIWILDKEIASDDFHVDSGINVFWDRQQPYDIIQIHWPEWIFNSAKERFWDKEFGQRLTETLCRWKKSGTRIVFTRHDERTHYVKGDDIRTNLFDIMESEADAIVHLGYFSRNQMFDCERLRDKIHAVIPHHTYDTLYPHSVSQAEARQALGIDAKFKVILTFGVFRDEEEVLLTKNAFEQLDDPDKYLLAPSWYHNTWNDYRNNHSIHKGSSWLGTGIVDRNMLPWCFAATDVVFIQRLRNLNSGNFPMAFFHNKTVVAPAIGNMTEYMDNINNFSFDPFDPSSVLSALQKGLARANYPQVNETYASEHWNTAKICEQYRQLYRQLIDGTKRSKPVSGVPFA